MYSKDLEILDLADGMYSGESRSGLLCPFCNGGSSGSDRAFSIKREDTCVLYICYRGSCGRSGKVSTTTAAAKEHRRERRVYHVPQEVDDIHREFVVRRYALSPSEYVRGEFGWVTDYSPPGKGRLYIPLLDYLGHHRGFAARDLYKEQSPKVLTFTFREDSNKYSWYYRSRNDPVILVEDAFSALRLSSYVNSVALSGTNVASEFVDELLRVPSSGVFFLALDKDATRSAIKQSLALRNRIQLRVLPLTKDVKDMTREELDNFIKGIIE